MPAVTYKGPGDLISFDGLEIERGETVELTEAEIARLEHAGAELEVDRESAEPAAAPRFASRPEEPAAPEPPAPAPSEEENPRELSSAEEEE